MGREYRVLALGGGMFRGAAQIDVGIQLCDEAEAEGHPYDLIVGVSIGALNGSMLAQGLYTQLQKTWFGDGVKGGLDDGFILNGVKGWISPAPFTDGLMSLSPTRKSLNRSFRRGRCTSIFGCGVTMHSTRSYKTYLTRMVDDPELNPVVCSSSRVMRDAIVCSSNIAWAMKSQTVSWDGSNDGDEVIAFDGGHRCVIPRVPLFATHVDVIPCFPDAAETTWKRPTSLFNNQLWLQDTREIQVHRADVDRLRIHARQPHAERVRVFFPPEDLGDPTDAKRETLAWRRGLSTWMLSNFDVL